MKIGNVQETIFGTFVNMFQDAVKTTGQFKENLEKIGSGLWGGQKQSSFTTYWANKMNRIILGSFINKK